MNISDWYLFQGVNNVIGFQRLVKPRLVGEPADEAVVAQAMPQARIVFGELSRLLGDQAYFAGGAPSLADMMIAPQLDFLRQTPEWPTLTSQNLTSWLDRMVARASLKATTWERIAALADVA